MKTGIKGRKSVLKVSKQLRICIKCHTGFMPHSNSQKFCLTCRILARIEILKHHHKIDNRRKHKKIGRIFYCLICGKLIPNDRTTHAWKYHQDKCIWQARHLRQHMERLQHKLDVGKTLSAPELILKNRIEKIFNKEIKKDVSLDNF